MGGVATPVGQSNETNIDPIPLMLTRDGEESFGFIMKSI